MTLALVALIDAYCKGFRPGSLYLLALKIDVVMIFFAFS